MSKHKASLQRERKIINAVKANPSSIKALEEKLGFNYYTVRNTVNSLVERGILTIHSTVDRNNIYQFNAEEVELHEYIPRLTDLVNKSTIKSIYLLEMVGRENNLKGTVAARNLPMYIAKLMGMAAKAENGIDIKQPLSEVREGMQKDFLYLKNITSLYEQMLKEPRYWTIEYLQEMVNDPDYVYPEVQKAVDYYDQQP